MLTIAERRAIAVREIGDAAFAAALRVDPRGASAAAIGRALPVDGKMRLLKEAPTDRRTAVENEVFTLLRDWPHLIAGGGADPGQLVANPGSLKR